MTPLQTALSLAEFSGKDDAAALAYGNAVVVIATDHTAYTWSGVGIKLLQNGASPADIINMATNITSLPGGPLLNACLNSGGFDFADATNRAIIQSFEINEPEWAVAILEAMLAIGETTGTRWQGWGVDQPLLADVTAARVAINSQQKWAQIVNEVVPPLLASGVSWAAIKSAIAGA